MGSSEAQKDEILLDKKTLEKIDFKVGDYIVLELPDDTLKQLKIVGIVQDASSGAGDFLAPSLAFVSMKTMLTLRQPDDLFNRAYITLSEGVDDLGYIHEAGGAIKDKLERNGTVVIRTRFSEKHKHPLADIINAVLGILMALGILIVLLSSSLIARFIFSSAISGRASSALLSPASGSDKPGPSGVDIFSRLSTGSISTRLSYPII